MFPCTPLHVPLYPSTCSPVLLYMFPCTPLHVPLYPSTCSPVPLYMFPCTPLHVPLYMPASHRKPAMKNKGLGTSLCRYKSHLLATIIHFILFPCCCRNMTQQEAMGLGTLLMVVPPYRRCQGVKPRQCKSSHGG